MVSKIVSVSATGDVTTVSTYLHAVILTGGSDAATATVKAGGSSGTTVLVLKAAAGASVAVDLYGALCSGGVHVTVAGTGPSVTFVTG